MSATRLLGPADEPALLAFLDAHLESSLFLVGNVLSAGLEDRGEALHGVYAAAFDAGAMTAVAAHYRNGIVLVQGDAGIEQAASDAVAASGRAVAGLIGPLHLIVRARRALGMDGRATRKDDAEILYGLALDRLRVPALLGSARVACRAPTPEELGGLLVDWRAAYAIETLGAVRGPALREEVRATLASASPAGWLLLDDSVPVAYSTFNAQARGVVQVGGVFTPPEHRGLGYARAVVAASLLEARATGATRSVLFTGRTNTAARRAYTALGYEERGPFGLALFA